MYLKVLKLLLVEWNTEISEYFKQQQPLGPGPPSLLFESYKYGNHSHA
jgi:hypothetical protein